MKYIYHFHAIYQNNPASVEHIDGTVEVSHKINSDERYKDLKYELQKRFRVDTRIIIENLSFLHKIED